VQANKEIMLIAKIFMGALSFICMPEIKFYTIETLEKYIKSTSEVECINSMNTYPNS
jgi:hypothetical protein